MPSIGSHPERSEQGRIYLEVGASRLRPPPIDRCLMDTRIPGDGPVGIALIDAMADDCGQIVAANRALASLLATTVEDLKGTVLCDLIHRDDRTRAVDAFTHMIGRGHSSCAGQGRMLVKEGGVRWVRVIGGLLPSDDAARVMVMLHINQIAEPSAGTASPTV